MKRPKSPAPEPLHALDTRGFVLPDIAARPPWGAVRKGVKEAVAAGTGSRDWHSTWGPGDVWRVAALVLQREPGAAVVVGTLLTDPATFDAPLDEAPCAPCLWVRTYARPGAELSPALVEDVVLAAGALGFQELPREAARWLVDAHGAVLDAPPE